MPIPYTRPQAQFNPAQSMQVPPPAMQDPSFAFMPPTYIQNVPAQPQSANPPYFAGGQPHAQPPLDIPSNLLNNAVNQNPYPRVNDNENIGGPTTILPRATKSPNRKNRRGKGKGKEIGRAEATGR